MAGKFEAKMKHIKSINHLRNSADTIGGLKIAFIESINPANNTGKNSRFETMNLKDKPEQTQNAASNEEIEQLKDSIQLINNTIGFTKLTEAEL